jgi:hypothetical protein
VASIFDVPTKVADAFYLLVHDHHSGKAFLDGQVTDLSIGAAVLAELIWAGLVVLDTDRAVAIPANVGVPRDLVQHAMLEEIDWERDPRPMADWMQVLGPLARPMIAQRLYRQRFHSPVRVPHVPVAGRLYLTATPRWVPENPLKAEAPRLHLGNLISSALAWERYELLLLALVCATGAQHRAFPFIAGHHLERIDHEATSRLPDPLPDLLRQLKHTVQGLVAAGRH